MGYNTLAPSIVLARSSSHLIFGFLFLVKPIHADTYISGHSLHAFAPRIASFYDLCRQLSHHEPKCPEGTILSISLMYPDPPTTIRI